MTRLLLHHPASSALLAGLGERFRPELLPVVPNVQAGRDLRGSLRGAGRLVPELLRTHLDPAAVGAVASGPRQRDVAAVYAAYVQRAQEALDFVRRLSASACCFCACVCDAALQGENGLEQTWAMAAAMFAHCNVCIGRVTVREDNVPASVNAYLRRASVPFC